MCKDLAQAEFSFFLLKYDYSISKTHVQFGLCIHLTFAILEIVNTLAHFALSFYVNNTVVSFSFVYNKHS